jgi:hypothetical protein
MPSRAAAIVFGICAALVLVETWARRADLKPRINVIGPSNLRFLDGVPVWEEPGDRTNRACVEQYPERTRVLIIGSSITFGYELRPEEAFTTALQARLKEVRPTPGFCVLNFAQPAFLFAQKYAVASVEVPHYRPALVLWEHWLDWMEYSPMGDKLYAAQSFRLRGDGFIGIAGVPDAMNRFLFLHSRAYEFVALTYGQRKPPASEQARMTDYLDQRLARVPRLAQSVGAKLAMYVAPPLNAPFRELADSPPTWHTDVIEFAHGRGIPVYSLARELIDKDYLELRMDPCCHLNVEGHRALVPIMARIILEQLDGGPGSP